ncbi:hypothetical protein LF65_05601 [Clostridium beijerinckii]|uniref:DUF4145 domain-containing protein n=1 Tax=Clostridium beijerinckii TaxID=1520 RepID=A0A0B5QYL1_CLOBE|nr:DUF4145 domain-containing protein [Clostridium beijerinckii]AJH02109.1 hypothetical protein LF65_05601 [Clostridium beijerinckii]
MRNFDTEYGWNSREELPSKDFICHNCGKNVCSNKGYRYGEKIGVEFIRYEDKAFIYICHNCEAPTYFDKEGKQVPGVLYGDNITFLSEEIEGVYNEARNCFSINAFTSVVLCCRKLLMNISCELGANEGLKFVQYIDYLENNNHIPSRAKQWVDKIRLLGNDGTHKLESRTKADAELAILFTSMLLKLIYEMPGRLDNI